MKAEFKPIPVLNRRIFKKNKGRNIVAVLAILMTAMMFTTLFTLVQSMNKNLVQMAFYQNGYDAQVSFKSITEEQAAQIAGHHDVKEVGTSIVLGLAENEELLGRQVELRWADESYAKHSFALPTTGRMPEQENEIALDTLTLDRLGIPHEIGESVTIRWRTDLKSDAYTDSTFTLCGFWKANESNYAGMAWVARSFADRMTNNEPADEGQILGITMAQVSLYSDRRIEAQMDSILADCGLSDLEYGVNLAYSDEMNTQMFQEGLSMYLGMVLVFAAGYLIIYNIFQMSVAADVRFYGMLKTLGTTRRQIRRLIYGQANRLCLIGIPAGLLLGWLLGMKLVPVFLGILEGNHTVSASPVIFIGSAVFAYLTVLISCLRPARLAGKISPIEALRMSDASSGSSKKRRKRESASLLSMAAANLGRNKKRTVLVICSLTLGLVLLSCFYAKNACFDMEKYLEELTIADFELADGTDEDTNGYQPQNTTLGERLEERVESLAGLERTGRLYTHQTDWRMDDQTIQNLDSFYADRMEEWASYDPYGAEQMQTAIQTGDAAAVLYGVDGIALEKAVQEQYLLDGTFDAEAFATGEYVIAVGPEMDKEQAADGIPAPSVGSTVELDGVSYKVMAVASVLAPVDKGSLEAGSEEKMNMHFLIPAETLLEKYPDTHLRRLYVDVDDAHLGEAQKLMDTLQEENAGLIVESRETMKAQYERETSSSAVMGNAVSVVIALVGILNFVNSMVTAIVSRKKEFAVIQSVGMTRKQLCRMLVFEGLAYALITLAVSYVLSAAAIGTVIRSMTAGGFSTFHFTLFPLLVCTPILIVFAVVIPYLCFRNLEKQSIVERLRME